jgi:tetratricopeptide (TPR) repeat protein
LTGQIPEAFFPFQHEAINALKSQGKEVSSPDISYHLGCLLYDNQPDQAIIAWEEAKRRTSTGAFEKLIHLKSLIHRNLGLAYAQHQKDSTKAIISLEDAVRLSPNEPRYLYELDVQNEAGGTAVKRRLEWLNPQVAAQRDDSLTRLILVYLADGQLDKALEILTTHRFHNWEGSSDIRNVYVDARLMRGQQHLRAKRAAEALKDFEAALEFPANLEVGRPRRDGQAARIAYYIALAHEALGNADKAKEFFTQASGDRGGGGGGASETSFYRALALQKVGRADDAKPIFENLVKQGQELQTSEPADYFAKFGEKRAERVRKADAHYLTGLGYIGLGKKAEADAEFKQALELHPAHLGALNVAR